MGYGEVQKLTEIDLTGLQVGEKLTIYRGSNSFLTGPAAAGYVGEATVVGIRPRSASISLRISDDTVRTYRIRFKDARICRVPNGEPTMLYVHARAGRPTVTAYFTADEYGLVKRLLEEEMATPTASRARRNWARSALDRMAWHDSRGQS